MFEKLADIIVNFVEVSRSMLGEVEDELDVEIDQEEAADIRTVQEAVDYLERISK